MDYYIVERKLKSGGSTLIALGDSGLHYCFKGHEMRFATWNSADSFRSWAESRMTVLEGQTGYLIVAHVRP